MKAASSLSCFPGTAATAPVRRLACGLWLFAVAAPLPAWAQAQAPGPAAAPLSEALKSALRNGLFEEEANRDFDRAITAYRTALELYDAQRPGAGTVLYRLAECLRKKGLPAEAVPLYRRVLAEFPADADLTADARRRLAELAPGEDAAPGDSFPAMTQEEANTLADLRVLAERNPEMLPGRSGTFMSAASGGSLPTVRFFVEHKVAGLDFPLALELAAKEGRLPVVRFLVEAGPPGLNFGSALSQAASAGNPAVTDYLLAHGADARKDGGAALIGAMRNGRTAVIYRLIDAGADLNAGAPDPEGAPAVPAAFPGAPKQPPGILRPLALALDARDERLARYLVEKGARCDVPSETGKVSGGSSPLHLAWTADLARFLMDHGADREARNPSGLTPVLTAAGNFEVMQALIDAGADLKVRDPEGGTVIYHLTSAVSGHPAFLDASRLPAPLAGNRQDMLVRDDPRIPALRAAAARILELAVKAGADVNAPVIQNSGPRRPYRGGEPPPADPALPVLAAACDWMETPAQAEFLEQLIRHGAKVNSADPQGVTPLHRAALRRRLPVLEALLRNGADPMAETTVPMELSESSFTRAQQDGQPRRPGGSDGDQSFFRYRPMHLIGTRREAAKDREAILLLARATYGRDFKERETGIWHDPSVLQGPNRRSGSLFKIADPELDGKKPVSLLEAVMRAQPGLEATASPEIHLLRRRAGAEPGGEAEDVVFNLEKLTAAGPPPVPELKPGDVLLLLPRPSTFDKNIGRETFEPLSRALALYLEERQAITVTLETPESMPDLKGEWRVFRPLLSPNDFRVDAIRHTAWNGLSLELALYGIFKFDQNAGLILHRIIREGGEEVTDQEPDYPYVMTRDDSRVFLRDGDRIEITAADPAAAPRPGLPYNNNPARRRTVLPQQR